MNRIEVNVITGEQTVVPLTPEEISEIENRPLPAPPLPFVLAEAHIAAYFSTPRLLQMKDWRDTFSAEDAPKLREVYDWTSNITIQAAQGQTTFTAPPHSFEELVAEAMNILGIPLSPNPAP